MRPLILNCINLYLSFSHDYINFYMLVQRHEWFILAYTNGSPDELDTDERQKAANQNYI